MSDVVILVVMLMFFAVGLTRPYVAYAAYIWIDIVVPQNLVFGFLVDMPLSMVTSVMFMVSLAFNVTQLVFPRVPSLPILVFCLLVWVTITTFAFADYPEPAKAKWDWVSRVMFMALPMMFVIRDRRELDFVLWVFFFSISFYAVSVGVKSTVGGGGYGANLVVGRGSNSGWSESSMLSLVVLLNLPLATHFLQHFSYFSSKFQNRFLWYGLSLLSIVAMVGTTARSGFVTLVGYLVYKNLKLWKLVLGIPIALTVAVIGVGFMPPDWVERMSTLQNVEAEGSAMTRIVVWMWTIDFVQQNWLGGGFDAYIANAGVLGAYHDGFIGYEPARAFHNSYFEVLGEHGYVGIALYLSMIFLSYRANAKVRKAELVGSYHHSLSTCLNSMIFLFCTSSLFIGIAFQPLVFILVGFSCVNYTIWIRQREQFDHEELASMDGKTSAYQRTI